MHTLTRSVGKTCPRTIHSIVMKNSQTLHLLPILALASLLIKISGSSSVRPVLTGPDRAYLGSWVVFWCRASNSSPPVRYELMSNSSVLMSTNIDPQGDQTVSLRMKASEALEGSYYCRATAGGTTQVSNSIKLTVVTPPSHTTVNSDPFPAVLYEGSRLVLSCDVERGSHLSYTWFFNRKEITSSAPTSDFFNLTGNKLVVEKVTQEHAGSYSCMAWSAVQDIKRFSSSTEVQVTIKVYVSKPEISFSVFQEGGSDFANLTCRSSRGSPPVNFSLFLDEMEVDSATAAESLVAWFRVDVVTGVNMGVAHCQVSTELQELKSGHVTLEIVPVGGDVTMTVEYLYTSTSKLAAAVLTCKVSRGTFPLFSWMLNGSVLPAGLREDYSHPEPNLPHLALVNERRTLILAKLGAEERGYYYCRARDSYNDSGLWVESEAQLVQVTELCMTPTELISISFCCFLLLMLVVGSACVFKMFDPSRAHPQTVPESSDTLSLFELTSQSEDRKTDSHHADFEVHNRGYR